MNLKLKKLYLSVKRLGFYIPFTWYFVLFSVAAILAYKWLQSKADVPDSAYKDIFALLVLLVIWFSVIILCLGLLSVVISFAYFKWKQKKTGIDFRIGVPPSGEQAGSKQIIS